MKPSAITINNLTVAYHTKPVLWNINVEIPQGILLAIVGPNGGGKTTLLKAILNLVKPVAGTISVLGTKHTQQHHLVAYIPQRSTVDWDFPATVFDVVLMGRYGNLGWFQRPQQIDYECVNQALAHVGLLSHATTPINELSGGQQQRLFLARALVQEASILLLDEPFMGIDSTTEQMIIALLKQLRDQGKTVVMVHHDLYTIEHYFDWLLLINAQQVAFGHVMDIFTPEYIRATYNAPSATTML